MGLKIGIYLIFHPTFFVSAIFACKHRKPGFGIDGLGKIRLHSQCSGDISTTRNRKSTVQIELDWAIEMEDFGVHTALGIVIQLCGVASDGHPVAAVKNLR